MTCSDTPSALAAEHLLLLRQLAAAQRRATALADALAQLQRQHQADEARWRALLADQEALITRGRHARSPDAPLTLVQRLAACWRRLEQRGMASDGARAAAHLVLCQTGCIGHGLPWRHGDQCIRTGAACTLAETHCASPRQPDTCGDGA